MNSINDVVKSGLCLGCGICTFEKSIGKTIFDTKRGQFVPCLPNGKSIDSPMAFDICPGKGYEIQNISKSLFGEQNYSDNLGFYYRTLIGHSLDKDVLANASSGGILTQLCFYLLDSKIVDKVIITKFDYTDQGPLTQTIITNQKNEILKCQGSKYCPVDISGVIDTIITGNEKIAYVGTPCQVAGIRKLQKYNDNLKKNIVLAISNFCGGFKNYNNIRLLSERSQIAHNEINYFNFRGGGKPTNLIIKDLNGKVVKIPYPDYVGYTGINGHLRCRLCVDATGELADISCGDAWLKQYQKNGDEWSFIICRSKYSYEIIEAMKNTGYIQINEADCDEIILSQSMNLNSKKHRQKTKYLLYKILGYQIPKFDGSFSNKYSSFVNEIKIFILGGVKTFLEFVGLYWVLYKSFKRIKIG
jgi:coenzyme F420 hydrogenase subunit beta